MKKLLIYLDESFLVQAGLFSPDEQFLFRIDENEDIDPAITQMLSAGALFDQIRSSEVIFITLSLSVNYLEFLGLRLAYHIRLSAQLGDASFLPIVIIGEENFQFIGQASEIPGILFTKGLYLMNDTKENLESRIRNFAKGRLRGLAEETEFLSRINIPAPTNYTTRHSLANEWSILRWASMGKNFSLELREELSLINTSNKTLYFRFLERKHELEMGKDRQSFNSNGAREDLLIKYIDEVKLYYIDDEASKGWGVLFQQGIFKEFADRQAFEFYADFQKGKAKDLQMPHLKAKIDEAIKNGFNLFIIDLRLFDDDFLVNAKPSGFDVIEYIRQQNPGVQIVIFTASTKADNVKRAQDLNVNEYLVKESPENMLTKRQSLEQFENFSIRIRSAAKWVHLAGLYDKISQIKKLNLFHSSLKDNEKDFHQKTYSRGGFLDRIFEFLNTHNESLIGTAYLNCFLMLEKFLNLFYREQTKGEVGYVMPRIGQEIPNVNPSTNNTFDITIELIFGNYPYEIVQDGKTPIDVKLHNSPVNRNAFSAFNSTRGLTRFLAVLHHRFGCTNSEAKTFMQLNYLRSNLAAHDTGKIDISDKQIKLADFYELLNFCIKIFSNA